MDLFRRFSQFRYTTLLVIALLLSSLRPVYAALSMQHISAVAASEDIMMICTGKGMKWASLSAFEANGQLTFVDPPTELDPSEIQHCPLYFWLDTQDQNDSITPIYLSFDDAERQVFCGGRDIAGVYTHPCPPSRAPPSIPT